MTTNRTKAILISIGGTPAPTVFSLNHQKPAYIEQLTYLLLLKVIDEKGLEIPAFRLKHSDPQV